MQDLRHLPHSTEQEWERTAAPQQELWVGYAPHQIVHGHPQQVTVCSQCQCEPQQIFQPDPIQPGHFRVVDAQMSQQYQYCDAVWPISPQRPYHTTAIQMAMVPAPHTVWIADDSPYQTVQHGYFTASTTPASTCLSSPVSAQPTFFSDMNQVIIPSTPVGIRDLPSSPYDDDMAYTPVTSMYSPTGSCFTAINYKNYSDEGYQEERVRVNYKCEACSKKFRTQHTFDKHQRLCHGSSPVQPKPKTRQTQVRCEVDGCVKVFGRQADASRHFRSIHQGNVHPCRYCNHTFGRSDTTRRHEMGGSCRRSRGRAKVKSRKDSE